MRIWKGIFGIQDLTKVRCGNQENDKYIDGIWDLTASREAELAKIWVQDVDFFACLSGIQEIVKTQIYVPAAKSNQPGEPQVVSPLKPN